jgi:hypothetical protein
MLFTLHTDGLHTQIEANLLSGRSTAPLSGIGAAIFPSAALPAVAPSDKKKKISPARNAILRALDTCSQPVRVHGHRFAPTSGDRTQSKSGGITRARDPADAVTRYTLTKVCAASEAFALHSQQVMPRIVAAGASNAAAASRVPAGEWREGIEF